MSDAPEPCLLCNGTGERLRYAAEPPDTPPEYVKRRWLDLRRALRAELEQYERNAEAIRAEIRALQNACPHAGDVHYNADASGGNDSWYECKVCGADLTVLKRNRALSEARKR